MRLALLIIHMTVFIQETNFNTDIIMKNLLYSISFGLLMGVMFSCDQSDQEVAPVGSIEGYATAVVTNMSDVNSFNEGDTLLVKVSLDKWLDKDLYFTLDVTAETGDESDISYNESDLVFPAYTSEIVIPIVILADDIVEETETMKVSVKMKGDEQYYAVQPASVFPTYDVTINNVNAEGVLTVNVGWDNPNNDLDIYIFSDIVGLLGGAESSDNPEICTDLYQAYYDVLYDEHGILLENFYLAVFPWYVEEDEIDLKIAFGEPDGTNTYFNDCALRINDLDDNKYIYDEENEVGGYIVMSIHLDEDGDFTFEQIDPHVVVE